MKIDIRIYFPDGTDKDHRDLDVDQVDFANDASLGITIREIDGTIYRSAGLPYELYKREVNT